MCRTDKPCVDISSSVPGHAFERAAARNRPRALCWSATGQGRQPHHCEEVSRSVGSSSVVSSEDFLMINQRYNFAVVLTSCRSCDISIALLVFSEFLYMKRSPACKTATCAIFTCVDTALLVRSLSLLHALSRAHYPAAQRQMSGCSCGGHVCCWTAARLLYERGLRCFQFFSSLFPHQHFWRWHNTFRYYDDAGLHTFSCGDT